MSIAQHPQPATVTGHVDVDGASLYYETAGEGRPLVLLHAGIADADMWDDQWSALAAHYRVIRYDLRGYGALDRHPCAICQPP